MNTRIAIGGLIALAFVVFGVTLYYSMRETESPRDENEVAEEAGYVPDVVNALHQFKDGVHIVAGEVDLPTPCDILESDAAVAVREPSEDLATIQFTTLHEGEICAQMLTPVRFKTSFTAGEDAEMKATWNGISVPLNIIEVGPGGDIDDFELYFKG